MSTYTNGIRGLRGAPGIAGALQGLAFNTATDWVGNGAFGRNMQANCRQDTTEGYPAGTPSLLFDHWGFWRFRWAVSVGTMSMTVYAKQVANVSPRPSVVLKANSAVGLLVDTTFSAGAGSGWEGIVASFVATGTGVIWVELWNNLKTVISCPCYFSGNNFIYWMNGVPVLDGADTGASVSGATAYKVSPKQEQLHQP